MKKAFFDGWDHLFGLLLLNAAMLALGLGLIGLASLAASLPAAIFTALALLSCLLIGAAFSGFVFATLRLADYGSLEPKAVAKALREGLVPGLQLGLMAGMAWLAFSIGFPFYLSLGGLGALGAGLLLWGALLLMLAMQWYLPLKARLGGGFKKNLRKSFVLLFDNPGFSIFLFFYNLAGLGLSLFLAFLAPGAAGIALSLNDALKLRLLKYDWLEAQAGAGLSPDRKRVPWNELLTEDKEMVGPRSLKGMIFPWKE